MSQTPPEPLEIAHRNAHAFLAKTGKLLIDGRWVESDGGKTLDVINPATGKTIASVVDASTTDVDRAVEAARRTFDSRIWRGKTADERCKTLWRLAELIESHHEELAYLETLHNGQPLTVWRRSALNNARVMRYFAGMPSRIAGKAASSSLSHAGSYHAYTIQEPVGVVAAITSWNGPLSIAVIKVAPALAAGCSVVLKPSETTPLTALRLGELALDAGIPAGVLNVVTGLGTGAGAQLAAHPGVNKLTFTGSTAVGKQLVHASAGNLKRLTLELGGKSPSIVFDDADMDIAIPAVSMGIFANAGQVCFAGSRLFVQRKSFDRVVAGVAAFAANIKIGNGLEPATQIGPIISAKQRERIFHYIESGKAEGARVAHGGRTSGTEGFFVEPTIFVETTPRMRIVREEIFGPVLAITPFDTVDEVVNLANDSDYGLGGGIFSTNVNTIHSVAEQISTGNIWVNCYGMLDPSMPFGGFKQSGWGQELGEDGLNAFLEKKAVLIKLA